MSSLGSILLPFTASPLNVSLLKNWEFSAKSKNGTEEEMHKMERETLKQIESFQFQLRLHLVALCIAQEPPVNGRWLRPLLVILSSRESEVLILKSELKGRAPLSHPLPIVPLILRLTQIKGFSNYAHNVPVESSLLLNWQEGETNQPALNPHAHN